MVGCALAVMSLIESKASALSPVSPPGLSWATDLLPLSECGDGKGPFSPDNWTVFACPPFIGDIALRVR